MHLRQIVEKSFEKDVDQPVDLQTVQPSIVIMIGLPGVGKSTLIAKRFPNYTVISSDNFIEQFAEREGKTYDQVFQKYVGRATGMMKDQFDRAVENNENIVWDQTNLTKKKRRGILQKVPKHYKKVAVVFNIPDEVRYARMNQRQGKSIPTHVIQNMERSYQAPTKDEGFDEIIEIRN